MTVYRLCFTNLESGKKMILEEYQSKKKAESRAKMWNELNEKNSRHIKVEVKPLIRLHL